MNTKCLFDRLISISEIKAHPKNRNKHPEEQIKRLAEILKYQGWRYPVKISKRSGFVTSGHGRIEAAKLNGWTQVPVNFQDYDSEEQEYADVQADNAIASWAELDLFDIKSDIEEFEFDIDLLGIKHFSIDLSETLVEEVNKGDENSAWAGMPEFKPAEKEIKLTIVFTTDLERELFVKKHNLPITNKFSGQWTSRV